MNLDKSSILPFDPVSRFWSALERIIERTPADVPVALRDKKVAALLAPLIPRANDAIQSGKFSLVDDLLAGFANALRGAVMLEREQGELKPWTGHDTMMPWVGTLSEHLFNGFECSHIQRMLPRESSITGINFRAVNWVISGHARGADAPQETVGTITREAVKNFARSQRPAWAYRVGDAEEFERNFTPEVKIKEAEAAAARRESKRHEISAGPQHLIGTSAR